MTWCSRMVITRKKSGGPRRCVDYQALNKFCSRETHHTMSPFHQATLFPGNMKKTVTDAWNGYHSVPIHEEDRHYTTFITPWGRYRYKTLPQGFVAAGDGYTRRYDEVVADIPHKTKCIDDVGMWAPTIEEAFFQTCKWMDICGRHGITQNPEKFHFAKDTVEFAGFEITTTNIRPSDTFIRAIKDFPMPRNITDVRSLFGLINQVSYCQSSSEELRPFRELLSASTPFYWDDTMDAALAHAKSEIIKTIAEGVKIFDKRRKTCLSTDWCKYGIGFSLGQKHCSCPSDEPWCCQTGWKLTFASNRYTHNAEENYAPVEGEALAVAWALDKARHFVLGCNDLIVATDHKPLLKVLGDRKMEDIKNPRLYNLKEKTLPFPFRITHVPGKRHFTADSLSRYASGDQTPTRWTCQTTHMRPVIHRYLLDFGGTRSGAGRTTRGTSATRLPYRKNIWHSEPWQHYHPSNRSPGTTSENRPPAIPPCDTCTTRSWWDSQKTAESCLNSLVSTTSTGPTSQSWRG